MPICFLFFVICLLSFSHSRKLKYSLTHSDHHYNVREAHVVFDDQETSLEYVVEAMVDNWGLETSVERPKEVVAQSLVSLIQSRLVEVEIGEIDHVTSSASSTAFLDGVQTVLINIGSSIDPIIPFMFTKLGETDTDVYYIFKSGTIKTIAFEPISAVKIEPRPWLTVVAAAVSSSSRMQQMYRYSGDGVSSSLYQAKYPEMFKAEYRDGSSVLVPVVSMQSVLDSIPAEVSTPFVKTDMQGADFEAIASVGRGIQRFGWLHTEVWHHGCKSYEQFDNDFCRDWYPHMTQMGYRVLDIGRDWATCSDVIANKDRIADFCLESIARYTSCEQIQECDILWVRDDILVSEDTRPPLGWNEFGMNSSAWFQ